MSLGSPLLAAEVRWLGEESCRRELEVREQVETMTARPVSSVEIADFELNVKSLAQDRWTLELTTVRREDGARSTRAIKGATCNEVTDAVAVAIALAIGPKEPVSKAMNEPKAAPKPRLAAPPEEPAPRARKMPAPQSSLEWFAGLGGGLDSSATPSVALGAALRLGLGWLPSNDSQTRLRFELQGALYAPPRPAMSAVRQGSFNFSM